jgi:predicted glutamine amidotransferase
MLSEEVYENIHGTTDSEHLFALFIEFYKQLKHNYSKENRLDLMATVVCKVITTVRGFGEELKKKDPKKYENEDFTNSLNLVVSDGNRIVATRYTTGPLTRAHTMFYCTGHHFHCHPSGATRVLKNSDVEVKEHNQIEEHEKMVIISSEPLTDEDDFKEIPPNYMVFADRSTIGLKSLEKIVV